MQRCIWKLIIHAIIISYDLGVIGGAVASSSFVATFHHPSANEM
jgi:hypothetical protein